MVVVEVVVVVEVDVVVEGSEVSDSPVGAGEVVDVVVEVEVEVVLVVVAVSATGAGGSNSASTTYRVPTLSDISPLAEIKIFGGVSPLLSSWKNQKLTSSSTTEPVFSTSASARSSDTSPGRPPNHVATGELSPETVTVPEPLPDVNGTTTETSLGASGAEDVEAATTVVAGTATV